MDGWIGGTWGMPVVRGPSGFGNDTCIDGAVGWYTQSVGETPCRTYERLRQQCNPHFRTPNMASTVPPDTCDDKNPTCCCNSLAFSLAMLCMNCQFGAGTNAANGINAGDGAYPAYVETCHPPLNSSLPQQLDSFFCTSPSIPEYLVTTSFFPTGQWLYNQTETSGTGQISLGKNTSICDEERAFLGPISGPTVVQTGTSMAVSATSSSSINGTAAGDSSFVAHAPVAAGTIAAAIIASLAFLIALVVAFLLCRIRRKRGSIFGSPRGSQPVEGDAYKTTPFTYPTKPVSVQLPVAATNLNRALTFTSVGPSIEPTRSDFSHAHVSPSSPPIVSPLPLPPPQELTAPRIDLTEGEEPSPALSSDMAYRNPGSQQYPFWAASPSTEAGDEADGERIRDSVLRSFDPRGMVRPHPPSLPSPMPPTRGRASPGVKFVVTNG